MVDAFALGITHLLLALAAWRLLLRDDLDREGPAANAKPAAARPAEDRADD